MSRPKKEENNDLIIPLIKEFDKSRCKQGHVVLCEQRAYPSSFSCYFKVKEHKIEL